MQAAQDQRGSSLPWHKTQRGKIGPPFEIAESLFPIRQLESIQRVHLDVDGEQVVAAVRAVFRDVLQKEIARETLADESSEHIGKGDDDGVDRASLYLGGELFEVHADSILRNIDVLQFGITFRGHSCRGRGRSRFA